MTSTDDLLGDRERNATIFPFGETTGADSSSEVPVRLASFAPLGSTA